MFLEEKLFHLSKRGQGKNCGKIQVGDIIKGAEVKGYSTFGCF